MNKFRTISIPTLLIAVFQFAYADELIVHYNRPDGDYDKWSLWSWAEGSDGKEYVSTAHDEYGLVFKIQFDNSVAKMGLIPKFGNWDSKDDPDRYWTSDKGKEIYILQSDKFVYSTRPDLSPRVVSAFLDDKNNIRLILSKSIDASAVNASAVKIMSSDGKNYLATKAELLGGARGKILKLTLSEEISPEDISSLNVSYSDFKPSRLSPGKIVDNYFDGRPLGAIYSRSRTVFRTFAPTASSVEVLLWDTAEGGGPKVMPMKKTGEGIWQANVEEDLLNRYYKYRSTVPEGVFEVIDPYSRCNTAHNGRGIIIHDETPIASGPNFPQSDAIIYEMHIRDFTIDPEGSLQYRGKYLGLVESGKTLLEHPDVATGLDHLKELGVNTIQIMPFQDFDNNESSDNYNWGYMPFHFNSPDGWFSTKRDDASRVREVKEMVSALHKAGFKVVMDVVYNHTAEGNPEVRMSFNGLAPNYYYRVKEDASYWNGSGCGNEFRTESPMGRKYIIDSMLYWVTEYGIDGFRFDLMGLIDLETVKQLSTAVRAVKPDAFIYGEPWAGGNTGARVTSKGDQRGQNFGVFNDHFRDALRGSAFSKDPGFIQTGRDVFRVKKGILGSISDFAQEPWESINYIEAHDNHTLYDRIKLTMQNRNELTEEDFERMDKLGAAIIMTSQGVPFIQSGQEMLRTKNGEDNTYNKPDEVNEIHWRWKLEHRDVFDYYKGLIALRESHPMFRMKKSDEVRRSLFFLDDDLGLTVPTSGVGYVLNKGTSGDEWENVLVLFNAHGGASEFSIPSSNWIPVANAEHSGTKPLGQTLAGDRCIVPEHSALIFYNNDPEFYKRVLEPKFAAKASRRHLFTVAAPNARKVTVAGSFNSWNMNQYALTSDGNGNYSIELELDPGIYEYKFIADGDWDALNSQNLTVKIP